MLYKFRSKASGDVVMTGDVGDRLMQLMGREPAPKGIFLPDQMPAAISALEQAIQAEDAARQQAQAEAAAEGRTLPPPKGISLRQRCWPLIEMMQRAQSARQEIVWGV